MQGARCQIQLGRCRRRRRRLRVPVCYDEPHQTQTTIGILTPHSDNASAQVLIWHLSVNSSPNYAGKYALIILHTIQILPALSVLLVNLDDRDFVNFIKYYYFTTMLSQQSTAILELTQVYGHHVLAKGKMVTVA